MKKMKTVKDFNVKDKRVLVRCDFDVPLNKQGNIVDDFKIKKSIPTIEYLIENKAKLVLIGHLGRPKGRVVENLRMKPIREKLSEILEIPIGKGNNQITILENLRFDKRERENNNKFSQKLARLGDVYINNAFANSHRPHASIIGIPEYLPSGAGFLLEKEVRILSKILKKPKKPLVAIIGGVKIETKAELIKNFSQIADQVIVGGKIGFDINLKSSKIYLPLDNKDGFDVGPKTIKMFSNIIKQAKTIILAGPMGKFEDPAYQEGTKRIIQEIIKNKKAFKIAGGGDTISALREYKLRDKFDHISTGGGAMLAFLAGEKLPGLEMLNYYGN